MCNLTESCNTDAITLGDNNFTPTTATISSGNTAYVDCALGHYLASDPTQNKYEVTCSFGEWSNDDQDFIPGENSPGK